PRDSLSGDVWRRSSDASINVKIKGTHDCQSLTSPQPSATARTANGCVASGAGLIQLQGVTYPHADGAGAEPDNFVRMIAPEAVFAQAGKPFRLGHPHDAVQFQRCELGKLLLACGFGHRSLCTSLGARRRLHAQKSEGAAKIVGVIFCRSL